MNSELNNSDEHRFIKGGNGGLVLRPKYLRDICRKMNMPSRLSDLLRSLSIVVLLLCVGCQKEDQPRGGMPTPEVVTSQPLKSMIVEWDEYVGRLEAVDFVEIRARVSGYLKSTNFDEGELVKAGDLTVAQAQRNASKARYDLAESDLERARGLRDKNVITAEEFENRSAGLLEAQANLQAFEAEVGSAEAAIKTAEADIVVAQASLESAELELSYTRIVAPISGRISQRYVTVGNLINGGSSQSTLLTTIVSLNPIYCTFFADESEYLKYARLDREGKRRSSRDYRNPVFVALSDEDEFTHEGHMDFVDNRLDQNTGTMLGRAILNNEDQFLTPGLFVRLRLPGSGRYEAIMLPDRAINTDQAQKFVYTVNGDKTVGKKPVKLGPLSHGLRIIREGLDGSEEVIVSGVTKVRPGMSVTTKSELITLGDNDGLPDNFEVVPKEKWLLPADQIQTELEVESPDPVPSETSPAEIVDPESSSTETSSLDSPGPVSEPEQ